jgi:hypothetical protein
VSEQVRRGDHEPMPEWLWAELYELAAGDPE